MKHRASAMSVALLWSLAGLGCSDFEVARVFAWFGQAAAALEVADRYASGDGVAQDPDEARRILRDFAQRGFVKAQYSLWQLSVTAPDDSAPQEGLRWLRIAAESGSSHAQLDLARLYLEGGAVEPDRDLAVTWLEKAAPWNATARGELGRFYLQMAESEELGSVRSLEACKAALMYLRSAGAAGVADAQKDMGLLYLSTRCGRDTFKAAGWLVRAEGQGDSEAAGLLARLTDVVGPDGRTYQIRPNPVVNERDHE